MTKEELKQEAEEWLCNNLHSANEEDFINAMVDIAEPREKRIAELEAQIEKLKGDLELWESGACRATNLDKCSVVKELKAQIEKMKTELHHRLVSPSHDDSDCLDKIVGLDRLWQFGQEF